MSNISNRKYNSLLRDIGVLLVEGRKQAFHAVDNILVETYWHIGQRIVEFEQHGKEKAEYGSRLLIDLSRDLKAEYGKGFSRSNLQYMRILYIKYPKCQTLSGILSWSHYTELLSISNQLFVSKYQLYIPNKKILEEELGFLLTQERMES